MDKVIRDGNVAVLVSPGYGAGWSTWADDAAKEWATFAPEVVAWVEAGKPGGSDAVEQMAKAALGEAYFYVGGAEGLEIEWLPAGTNFRIEEYHGNESLVTQTGGYWNVA